MFRGATVCVLGALAFALFFTGAAAKAQDAPNESLDREARALFDAGSTAFEDARYADALSYFRRAYELSHRPGLLYNVGLAADRLRHDEEALAAFEQFLAEAGDSPRRRDVEARVAAIRTAIEARRAATPVGPPDASPDAQPPPAHDTAAPHDAAAPPSDRAAGGSSVWLAGPIALGTVGLAGGIAALVGIAGAGGCVDMSPSGCVEERGTNGLAVGIYGGVGLAAIAGAVIWLIVGLSGDDDGGPSVATRNGTTELSWRF